MKSKLMLFFFIALFSSCSSVRVVYDYDSTIDFNNYSTFAFSKQEIEKLEISDIDKKRILNSIEQSMKEKGYDFSSSPDLIINISTKSREDIYINQSYNRFGFGWYGFPYEQTYRPNSRIIGLLYIDVLDGKTKNLIWQGNGSGSLYSNKFSRDELILNFVNEVMESFPYKL
jgi:hypothetical protein